MNSLTLKENGFAEFVPIKQLSFSNVPYNANSVLVIADTKTDAKAASDILYIGRSRKLTRRLFGGYLSGYGGKTTQKISGKLLDEGYIERVAFSWLLVDDPKAKQQELLANYKKEHGEFPAWNALKKAVKTPPVAPVAKPRSARKPVKRGS
jgi:hypothetical protein